MQCKTMRSGTIVLQNEAKRIRAFAQYESSVSVRLFGGDDYEYVQVRSLGLWHLTRITPSYEFYLAFAVFDDFGNLTIPHGWRHVR